MTTATADPSIVDDPPPPAKSFVHHAKLIGGLTLVSRFFGLGREVAVTHYLGTGWVASAFAAAFAVPNLFRKLFGEGALSAAFIPLYAQQVKTQSTEAANGFAAAAVNLLIAILVGLTVVGELVIAGLLVWAKLPGRPVREDFVLTLKLAAVMLPYVLLICGGAFLSGILQVHKRFGVPAATPIILNAVQIVVLLVGAHLIHLGGRADGTAVEAKQLRLAYGLAAFVLVAGALQVAVLLPSLREAGFRFRFVPHFWTPAVKAMLVRSVPVALGAGVLQLSVLLDKSITLLLVQGVDTHDQLVTTFRFMGRAVRLPMEIGALKRLDVAQFLYQFPLGIFAIALATAIFPGLSADALDHDRERFRAVLRQGIRASLWEGIPASLGLILVAGPATKLLFLNGHVSTHDADLIARSTAVYAGAIWAFSLLQIINRAFYAVHDMTTPLLMSAVNLAINLAVEIPLLWWLGEAGMAVGTLVSFAVQSVVMLWMLDRKVGGLDLPHTLAPVAKMVLATAVMGVACYAVEKSPLYPHGDGRPAWAGQLALLLSVGVVAYLGACAALGEHTMADLLPRRWRR
jgi:putative peptidoglycan lipid II flippase